MRIQKPHTVNRHFSQSPTKRQVLGISSTPLSQQKHSISQQLQQCDQFQSQSITQDNRIDEKTSFVSNMTQRKRIQKKKKIINYLQEHRNNLPTQRDRRLKEQVMVANQDQDEFQQQNGNLQNQLQLIQHTEIKNRLFQKFILQFNKNPQLAIQMFIQKNVIKQNTPQSIANYLLKVQGINKNVLGQYFGKNDQKVLAILHAYCDLLGFHQLEFDLALRKLLSKFLLPGQAQQIQRIVWEFAQSYYAQNIQTYQNAQELFPLAYSIIMLATDAHNPKQEKKMTSQQFVKNTQRACPSFANQYLQRVYSRIVKQKLQIQKSVYQKLTDLYLTSAKQALSFAQQLKRGTIVWKIALNEKKWYKWRHMDECEFYKRKLFLSQDESKICWQDPTNPTQQPRHIQICTITDITLGIATHLSSKMNIPKQCDNQYFTITTPLRTLDIRTQNARVRARWLGYLRGVMILKRERRIQQLQRNCVIRRQQLEEIWHSEVFPKWDLYWDYDQKKPRQKGFFKQKVEKFCHCFTKRTTTQQPILLGLPSTNNLLQTLFRYGLPPSIRKPLWDELIGNTLQMNQPIIQHIKHSAIYSFKLRGMSSQSQIVQMAEFLLTLRPDLPQVKDLLQMARVLHKVYINEKGRLMAMANLVFKYHFLPFYKGDRLQIQLRTKLFDYLLQLNTPFVKLHLDAIKLQTRLYLVPWFLSIFSSVFKQQQTLLRIWDNFLLQGELYLFKVGIALVKYFEIELKMCTFYQGLKLLKFSNVEKSSLLFFDILEKQINVKQQHYYQYVLRRKHAMVKTKIQSIPLG